MPRPGRHSGRAAGRAGRRAGERDQAAARAEECRARAAAGPGWPPSRATPAPAAARQPPPRRDRTGARARGSPAGGQHRAAPDRAGSGGGGHAGTARRPHRQKPAVTAPPQWRLASSTRSTDCWWVLALAGAGCSDSSAARIVRSRRSSEFDDSLGRLAAAGADAAELGAMSATRNFAEPEPVVPAPRATARAAAAPLPEAAFLVEESGTHERPRLSATGTVPAMAAPKHVASDETISSETAINLDQGDPLAEADFHMAYGLYDQAADLVRIAISARARAPRSEAEAPRSVLRVGQQGAVPADAPASWRETRERARPGEWEKIVIMGKQLAPEDPLFSGGGGVGGGRRRWRRPRSRRRPEPRRLRPAGRARCPTRHRRRRPRHRLGAGRPEATAESQTASRTRNARAARGRASVGTARHHAADDAADARASDADVRLRRRRKRPTVEQPRCTRRTTRRSARRSRRRMQQGGGRADRGARHRRSRPGSRRARHDGPARHRLGAASTPDAPTLVAGLDEQSRRIMDEADAAARRRGRHRFRPPAPGSSTSDELEAALR